MIQAVIAEGPDFKNYRKGLLPLIQAPTFAFFSGLGGSSLFGGVVMSFPVTPTAAFPSSSCLAIPKEWRVNENYPKQMCF